MTGPERFQALIDDLLDMITEYGGKFTLEGRGRGMSGHVVLDDEATVHFEFRSELTDPGDRPEPAEAAS